MSQKGSDVQTNGEHICDKKNPARGGKNCRHLVLYFFFDYVVSMPLLFVLYEVRSGLTVHL